MQAADITILIILAIPALVGVFYGFLNIVFSLMAWVLASGIAIKVTPMITPMLESYIETPLLRLGLAFAGLFIISLMIFSILGYFIVKLLGRTGLTAADRILGLSFGFGLGIVIVGAVIFLAGFTAFPKEQWWRESRMIEPFERISVWGHRYLPEGMAKHHDYEYEQPPSVAPQEPAAPVIEQSQNANT